MQRIKTRFGEDCHVLTLYFMGKWVTISVVGKKTSSTDAPTLQEAGSNHLVACHKVKELYEQRGRLTEQLLHGTGHPRTDSHGVSDSSHQPDQSGIDGGHRGERQEDVPTDEDAEDYKDTFAF